MDQIIKIEKTGILKLPKEVIKPLELKKDDRLMVFSSEVGGKPSKNPSTLF